MFSGIVASKENEVADRLREVDINTLSPMQAFLLLSDLKEKLEEEN